MGSPVTSTDFNVPNYAGSLCDQIKQLLGIASKLKQWFEWAFESDGDATAAFRAEFSSAAFPTGGIIFWPIDTLPSGYAVCNGQALSRTTYATLFGVIGVEYGVGDGTTTFNLPNLSGRIPLGSNGTYPIKSTGGSATKALSISEMPAHTHAISLNTDTAGADNVQSLAAQGDNTAFQSVSTDSKGSGTAFSILNPYLAGHWLIKT